MVSSRHFSNSLTVGIRMEPWTPSVPDALRLPTRSRPRLNERVHLCDPVLVERYNGAKQPCSELVENSRNWKFPKNGKSKW